MWKALALLVTVAAAQGLHILEPVDGDINASHSSLFQDVSTRSAVRQVATQGQFPYQVGIWVRDTAKGKNKAFCGGALITKKIVITSAHCASAGEAFFIVLGANNVDDRNAITRVATKKLIHENYKAGIQHDIALLQFSPGLLYFHDLITSIRLPAPDEVKESFWKSNATMSGWGDILPGAQSPNLGFYSSRVALNLYCQLRYLFRHFIRQTNICVSSVKTCPGDSGNPLVAYESDDKPTLIGIASFDVLADGCEASRPAIFTRITPYLDWIANGTETLERHSHW